MWCSGLYSRPYMLENYTKISFRHTQRIHNICTHYTQAPLQQQVRGHAHTHTRTGRQAAVSLSNPRGGGGRQRAGVPSTVGCVTPRRTTRDGPGYGRPDAAECVWVFIPLSTRRPLCVLVRWWTVRHTNTRGVHTHTLIPRSLPSSALVSLEHASTSPPKPY